MPMHRVRGWMVGLLLATTVTGLARTASAHWCDCLWASRYNIVIRPETDSVDVPPKPGYADLRIWVQNNMGYPLIEYSLEAYSTAATVRVLSPKSGTVSPPALKFPSDSQGYRYLLPGESAEQLLRIESNGAATTLGAGDITFYVHFSNPQNETGPQNDQGHTYGNHDSSPDPSNPPGGAAVVKLSTANAPSAPDIDGDSTGSQARHIVNSARVDFGDATASTQGINNLFNEYCSGTGSWATDGVSSPIVNCASSSVTSGAFNCCGPDGTTVCNRHTFNGGNDKFKWQHLWAASELGYRKSALTPAQLATLRERLLCGAWDTHLAFKGMAFFVLGYLGPDSTTQTALTTRLSTATGSEAAMIKAALYMMSNGGSYGADMDACVAMTEPYAEMVCAAAQSHVLRKAADATVQTELIARVFWGPHPPESQVQTAQGLFAAHVLNVLAWDRRGWAKGGGNNGAVSFYNTEVGDTVAPGVPVNPRCDVVGTGTASPALVVSWDAGRGAPTSYKLYQGTVARPGTCADPSTLCHSSYYQNSHAELPGASFAPPDLTPGSRYYFAVTASNAAGKESGFSTEVSCVAPLPQRPPVAALTCDTTTGVVPPDVTVSCNCAESTDPDGDIEHCWFALDAGTPEDHPTGAWTHVFTTGASSTLTLRVVDATGLEDSTSTTITINSANNQSPSAIIVPSALTCAPGATLDFASTGSADPDGTIVAWRWRFSDDQSEATTASTSHTFATAGTYTVSLMVTDNSGATGTAVVDITVAVAPNEPPVLTGAVVPSSLRPNTDFVCDGSGVTDPENGVVSLTWEFGDGTSPVTGRTATHRYGADGTYTVSLTATDDGQPPATSRREWQVHVAVSPVQPGGGELVTSCAGGRPGNALILALVTALGYLVLGRRRGR